jgi:hypothetical protein
MAEKRAQQGSLLDFFSKKAKPNNDESILAGEDSDMEESLSSGDRMLPPPPSELEPRISGMGLISGSEAQNQKCVPIILYLELQ